MFSEFILRLNIPSWNIGRFVTEFFCIGFPQRGRGSPGVRQNLYLIIIRLIYSHPGRVAISGSRIVAGDVRGALMKWEMGEEGDQVM